MNQGGESPVPFSRYHDETTELVSRVANIEGQLEQFATKAEAATSADLEGVRKAVSQEVSTLRGEISDGI